ncbi:hypothetical protein V8F33_007387 [Rhypophila sp. PSN 637]
MLQPLEQRNFNPKLMPNTGELAQYDFTDKSTLTPAIWNVNLTFIVLVSVVVSLRVFTRAYMTKHFFADDVLTIIAAVFIIVSAATALAATKYGLGLHVWNLPQPMFENITQCVQLMFVAHIFYAAASTFTKLSIITSYLRIFPETSLRRLLYATAVLVVGIGISAIFATIFQCWPVQSAWDFSIEHRQCFQFRDFLYANAAISIVTDFLLVAAPLPYFWSLRLPLRQRLVICVLFGVGFVAFGASVVRIVTLHDVKGIDITYYLVSPLNWTVIECSLGIICISVPPMRPLLAKIFPTFISDYLGRYATFGGSHHYNSNVASSSKTRSRPRSTVRPPTGHLDMERQLRHYEQMGGMGEMGSLGHQQSEKTIEMVTMDNASSTAELTEQDNYEAL